jgi:hypothetical protein
MYYLPDENNNLFVKCPHCEGMMELPINELNCRIFRHGVLKCNTQQVNPHLSKQECDNLVQHDLVFGCCRPFIIVVNENKYYINICDYI